MDLEYELEERVGTGPSGDMQRIGRGWKIIVENIIIAIGLIIIPALVCFYLPAAVVMIPSWCYLSVSSAVAPGLQSILLF